MWDYVVSQDFRLDAADHICITMESVLRVLSRFCCFHHQCLAHVAAIPATVVKCVLPMLLTAQIRPHHLSTHLVCSNCCATHPSLYLLTHSLVHGTRFNILASGLVFYAYNELATMTIAKTNAVTQSVANTAKRVIVIVGVQGCCSATEVAVLDQMRRVGR